MSKPGPHVSNTDTITLLVCSDGYSASKTIVRSENSSIEINGFNAGKFFKVVERTVGGIKELSNTLLAIEPLPNTLVIRGSPIPSCSMARTRRIKANFVSRPEGKYWIMLDFDKLPCPAGLDLASDPESAMNYLVGLLPAEFQDVTYHYQLSSSAGFSGTDSLSAHLWYWLSSPRTDAELKRWAKSINSNRRLVDPALFNDVQAHYTAAPIFQGITNPFPVRSGLISKKHPAVEIQVPEPTLSISSATKISPQTELGFDGFLAAIGDHPGGDGFHEPIIRAIASYVSSKGKFGTDVQALFETVRDRILTADRSAHDEQYVDQMASEAHIKPAIASALEKFGNDTSARRRSRVIAGNAPPPPKICLTAADAHKALAAALEKIIVPEST